MTIAHTPRLHCGADVAHAIACLCHRKLMKRILHGCPDSDAQRVLAWAMQATQPRTATKGSGFPATASASSSVQKPSLMRGWRSPRLVCPRTVWKSRTWAKLRRRTMRVHWSAAGPPAWAVQADTSMVRFLQPPPTELTCVRVAHHRLRTFVAKRPNIKEAIVPRVICVQMLGNGIQDLVPIRVRSPMVGHLHAAIRVANAAMIISVVKSLEPLPGHIQPIRRSHSAWTRKVRAVERRLGSLVYQC